MDEVVLDVALLLVEEDVTVVEAVGEAVGLLVVGVTVGEAVGGAVGLSVAGERARKSAYSDTREIAKEGGTRAVLG